MSTIIFNIIANKVKLINTAKCKNIITKIAIKHLKRSAEADLNFITHS